MTTVRLRLALGLLTLGIGSAASTARADGPFEGTWRTSPMQVGVSVQSWGGDCGPRPQSTTIPGGATVRVSQSGDDLTFHGRRPRSTTGCWSENAHVRRVSRSYEGGTWQVVCRTPDDDPRAETGRYTLSASGTNRITFRDVSQYNWTLNESRCVATITSTQTFTRVAGSSEPEERESEPTENNGSGTSPRTNRCASPGQPARLIVRPAQADAQPGEQLCFASRVIDSRGCGLRRTVRFSASAGEVDNACLTVPASMLGGEIRVSARSGSLSANATVRVRELDFSDLIARRTEGGGAVVSDDAEIDGATARVAARQESSDSTLWYALLGGGLLLVVAVLVALLASRRKSSQPERDERTSVPPPTEPMAVEGGQKICPQCRRGYPPTALRCQSDGTELVPYADFVANAGMKVCPECGERYPATRSFCGKDGATLVEASASRSNSDIS